MRIGKHRNGSKVGVFLYCQQHAREWATPLTCLETAEQLLRNYAIDRRTRELVDNLDIFILPSSNPDGSHYSMYNFNFQRRTMTNWCVEGGEETDDPFASNFWTPRTRPDTGAPYVNSDPGSRNAWGVDLNRNNTVGTIFDGYIGASYSCTSDVYTGPGEASEPEIKNELWIADTFDNIKFSNNIHSFGGYFMWAPGAYLPDRGEGDLEHANIGIEKYFFAAGDQILNRIKDERNTAILPARTGPIADVLYSAGGNSADEHWYRRGVIAYSFETGADLYFTLTGAASAAGANGIRIGDNAGGIEYLKPGDRLRVDTAGANPETRVVAQVIPETPTNPNPNPNVIFTEPLAFDHPAGARVEGAALQTGVGFQPDYATEGKYEALEFAAGNYGLLEEALEYARDDENPQVRMTGPADSPEPIETTFEYVNEPSVIRYTTDGTRPNLSSALWDSTGPREPGEVFTVSQTTTFRWRAEDIAGNVSYGSMRFRIR
jgi:Zinc carboxypeptidase/Chitobiase/beta-hexosaminidase C-terminal domain